MHIVLNGDRIDYDPTTTDKAVLIEYLSHHLAVMDSIKAQLEVRAQEDKRWASSAISAMRGHKRCAKVLREELARRAQVSKQQAITQGRREPLHWFHLAVKATVDADTLTTFWQKARKMADEAGIQLFDNPKDNG